MAVGASVIRLEPLRLSWISFVVSLPAGRLYDPWSRRKDIVCGLTLGVHVEVVVYQVVFEELFGLFLVTHRTP